MNAQPIINGCVYLPFDLFDRPLAQAVKKRLTFTVKSFHPSEPDRRIETYWLDQENRRIRVPFTYGLQLLQNLTSGTGTTKPLVKIAEGFDIGRPPTFPNPFHPAAPKDQDRFFDDLEQAMRTQRTTLAVAPTGSGKTAAALNAIGRIGKTALIVVPSKELVLQWKREIKKHLGWDEDVIGSLEEGQCYYEGKKIVLAVIHNIFQRRLSTEFKEYFGVVVWDEAHRLGAEMFGQTFGTFPARCRVGLTATPDRRDRLTPIITDCFGAPSVHASCDALPCEVRVVNHPTHMPEWRFISRGTLISRLTTNQSRNTFVCRILKEELFDDGRNILVLSDRVGQLQSLMLQLQAMGVAENKMGLYTRSYVVNGKAKSHTAAQLEVVREQAQIIFSTYGMGKEAMDIPRLDAGIDVSPRADGVQAIGRIRRPYPNKRMPLWITIRDRGIPILERMTESRARDYRKSKAKVIDHG